MSSVQLASFTLRHNPDGSNVRAILEWRKDAGYAAYIADVSPSAEASFRQVVLANDVPTGLRILADLVEAEQTPSGG